MPAFAQVLRQEPSLALIGVTYGLVAGGGYLLCRYRYWALFFVLPGALILCFPILMELYDPAVGPQLRRESLAYVIACHVALLSALLVPYWGARQQIRELRSTSDRTTPPGPPVPLSKTPPKSAPSP